MGIKQQYEAIKAAKQRKIEAQKSAPLTGNQKSGMYTKLMNALVKAGMERSKASHTASNLIYR